MWAPDSLLANLYKQSVPRITGHYDRNWKINVTALFQHLLGHFPSLGEKALNPRLIENIDKKDYRRLRVEITTIDHLRAPIYILIPKRKTKSKFPVVLALHGHGFGSKEIVGLNPDGTENDGEPGIHKNCAIELVRKGMVVVVPEIIGFGDRKLSRDAHSNKPDQNSCFALASQLLLMGKTLAGLRVYECKRVIDFINTMDEVDSDKIGCFGFSGGGLVAAFTSIVDQRIKATVLSGYTNTFKGSIMKQNHCLDNYIPGILQLGEMSELIGLIAPRPLFIESGMNDMLFPVEHVKKAMNTLSLIYENFQAGDHVNFHIFEGKHEISGEKSYEWLYNTLLLTKQHARG